MVGSFQVGRIPRALPPSPSPFPDLLREHNAGEPHRAAGIRAKRQSLPEDQDAADDRDERARVDVGARRRRRNSLQRAEPDSIATERRESAEVQDWNPAREAHRLDIGEDTPSRRDQERHQEDRSDEERPRDERERRGPAGGGFGGGRTQGGGKRRGGDRPGGLGSAGSGMTSLPGRADPG